MNIWLVTREYAGVAEAGGVKNVATSLSESLVRLGHRLTVFIPLYECTDLSLIENFQCFYHAPVNVFVGNQLNTVSFSRGILNGVEIVFVCHKSFAEKQAVYTYTRQEELENPKHKQGQGHEDASFLDVLFQKAIVAFGSETCSRSDCPDIIHCQDAAAALVPSFARMNSWFERTKFFVTIHNAGPGYHHEFCSLENALYLTGLPENVLQKALNENGITVEPYILASFCSKLTTVSPEYAKEILLEKTDTAGLSSVFRNNGTEIIGITNGMDFLRYEPNNTEVSLLPYAFDPQRYELEGKYECRKYLLGHYTEQHIDKKFVHPNGIVQYGHISFDEGKNQDDYVYVIYHGRVVHQKGIQVMAECISNLINKDNNMRFIFLGQGAPELEEMLKTLAIVSDGKCVYLKGYDKYLSRMVIASGDFALMPSYFEPCGLEDFIAQTYGTLPVAHATGGLCKIIDDETGYLYKPNTSAKLEESLLSLSRLMKSAGRDIFKPMIAYASKFIHQNYSWNKVALEYETLFND